MDTDLTYTLITGGSRGIGNALARECAGRGMNLLLVARQSDTLEAAALKLSSEFPVRLHTMAVDLRDMDGPLKVWEWCEKENYRVDVLINNAGSAGSAVFQNSDPAYSDDRILVNIRSLVLLTRYFLPELKTHPRSHILNIGSLSAFTPIAYKSVYSASKAFAHNFTRALRQELKESNIRITIVHPNGVRTNAGTHERIDTHSRFSKMFFVLDVGDIARISVKGMLKGKKVIVPGFMNYLLVISIRMVPAGIRDRLMARLARKELRSTTPGS